MAINVIIGLKISKSPIEKIMHVIICSEVILA